jgi:hypothetical protein
VRPISLTLTTVAMTITKTKNDFSLIGCLQTIAEINTKYICRNQYKDINELLSRDHIQIENELIHFIITCKNKGTKHAAIMNWPK